MTLRTAAFDSYIGPARSRPQLWRLILGIIMTIGGMIGALLALETLALQVGWLSYDQTDYNLVTKEALTIGFLGFGGAILGLWLAVRVLHGRGFATLLGERKHLWRHFMIGAGVVLVVNGSWAIISAMLFGGLLPNNPLSAVLMFLPVATVLLLIQTGAEELLFRGYMMQQLAVRFVSPIIWFVLPSVVFGLVHYDAGSMGAMIWPIIGALTLTGLLWADLVRVTGSIGAAWGWHFMNNFLLLNFATMQGSMTGFSWKVTNFGPDDLTLLHVLPEFGLAILIWAILRRLLRD